MTRMAETVAGSRLREALRHRALLVVRVRGRRPVAPPLPVHVLPVYVLPPLF